MFAAGNNTLFRLFCPIVLKEKENPTQRRVLTPRRSPLFVRASLGRYCFTIIGGHVIAIVMLGIIFLCVQLLFHKREVTCGGGVGLNLRKQLKMIECMLQD